MHAWFRFERESDVLIANGRKGRGERLISDDLRDGRIVIDRSKAGVEDGITRSQLERGVFLLGSAQSHVLELPDRTLVHGKRGGQMIEAKSHEREAAAEGCERLTEDRILLALQLCEQGANGLIAGLVDAARGNQLVDQALDVLSAKSRECGHRNVIKIESIRDMQPNIAHVGVAHLENFQ